MPKLLFDGSPEELVIAWMEKTKENRKERTEDGK